eukprot:3151696-Alexandrium_andersonii.AAC.1
MPMRRYGWHAHGTLKPAKEKMMSAHAHTTLNGGIVVRRTGKLLACFGSSPGTCETGNGD